MMESFEGVYVPDGPPDMVGDRAIEWLKGAGFEPADPEAGDSAPTVTLVLGRSRTGVVELAGLPHGDGEALARELSREFGRCLSAGVFESDVWYYALFQGGEAVDRFLSVPEYYGPVEEDERRLLQGDPLKVAEAWPGADAGRLEVLLRSQAAQAETLLMDFLEELGVPGALEPLGADSLRRIGLKPPPGRQDAGGADLSEEEQEDALREMFQALGVDDGRAQQYVGLMKEMGDLAPDTDEELGEADLEALLRGNPKMSELNRKLADMRGDIMSALERSVQQAEDGDPELKGSIARWEEAARIEASAAENMLRFDRDPKGAIRANAELLRTVFRDRLQADPGRDREAVVEVDELLTRLRREERPFMRDISDPLPLLVACYVADCLLASGNLDLMRQPRERRFFLRKSDGEGDPLTWAIRALSRRDPVAIAEQVREFFGD